MAEKETTRLTPGEVIRYRRTRYLIGQGYLSLLLRCALLILVLYVMLNNVFLLTNITGNEMYPSVKDGDIAFAYRLQDKYSKNDVVIYLQDGQPRTGRIVGRENDIVLIGEDGTLQVNGTTQAGEILYPTYPKEGITYPFAVPAGNVFILGDYRTQTVDSRDFGPVPVSAIQGKVITILRRRGI